MCTASAKTKPTQVPRRVGRTPDRSKPSQTIVQGWRAPALSPRLSQICVSAPHNIHTYAGCLPGSDQVEEALPQFPQHSLLLLPPPRALRSLSIPPRWVGAPPLLSGHSHMATAGPDRLV